jgi:hypothetical protein
MARVFLNEGDVHLVADASTVFGSILYDSVQLSNSATNAAVNANVDAIRFSGNIESYQFSVVGNQMKAWLNGSLMATIGIQSDSDGLDLIFANIETSVSLTGMGKANFGAYSLTSETAKTISVDLVNTGIDTEIPLITLHGSQTQNVRSVQHVLHTGDYQVKFDVSDASTQFLLDLASPVLTSAANVTTGKQTILNFGANDSLQVKTGQIMSISSTGSDVNIGVLSLATGSMDTVVLVGVNTGGAVVNNVTTFNALAVGDITLI